MNVYVISYKRPECISCRVMAALGFKVIVVIDNESDDKEVYAEMCEKYGADLEVFDIKSERMKYDFVSLPNKVKRAAGMARNAVHDIARKRGEEIYCVMDDDTIGFEIKEGGRYERMANSEDVKEAFTKVARFMRTKRIGLFGITQTGDYIGMMTNAWVPKVMNCTFVQTKYLYKGERGLQNNDTSQFVSVWSRGLMTGSLANGVVLKQRPSGKYTEMYAAIKLLNKALIPVMQFPSAIIACRQIRNGGRMHHKIEYKYLRPMICKSELRDNIAWDIYPEDVCFTLAR